MNRVIKLNQVKKSEELKYVAGKYLNHEFNILGSGWRKVCYGMKCDGFENKNYMVEWSLDRAEAEIPGFYRDEHREARTIVSCHNQDYTPIDWQIDFKSGARFSASTHHSELKYGVVDGVDAKVSADLGRLYQLPILAKASNAFNSNIYRQEMMAQLFDFIAFNPPEYGAAWRANMNVSIRAANIIVAMNMADTEQLSETEQNLIERTLEEHGRYIYDNLEFPREHYHPNHFIANLAGLLIIACALENICQDAGEWYNYAVKTIKEQIVYQNYPEGTNFEAATSYHCLVLEMLTGALIYAARSQGRESPGKISGWIAENIGEKSFIIYREMFEVYKNMVQPDGLIPLIGDNDSGRFLYLEGTGLNKRDYRFLSVVGAMLFENPGLAVEHDQRHIEYAEILLGVKGENIIPACPHSIAYQEAGYYIMRDAEVEAFAFINCGPVGTNGKGGHSHNDKLAFTLQINGKDIFTDPGIYVYTAGAFFRNSYRSVKSHNTLCLDGCEQNRWGLDNEWWGVTDETKCEKLKWETSAGKDIFRGRHNAYMRLRCRAVHEREIEWRKKKRFLIISDFIIAEGEIPPAECGFILSPECVITACSDKKVKIKNDATEIEMISKNGIWKTEPAYCSPEYGEKIYTQRLVLKMPSGTAENKIKINY